MYMGNTEKIKPETVIEQVKMKRHTHLHDKIRTNDNGSRGVEAKHIDT